MSGHSKWANIKRKKEVNDPKKGKVFSKYARLITVAVRQGGGDASANPVLRLAIERAKEARMPKENIERAIHKGVGGTTDDRNFDEVTYEGYGPFGVAFLIRGLTDNKNRTVSEIRNIFSKANGALGSAGGTSYIFLPDPQTPSYLVTINSIDDAKKVLNLVDLLEDHDDITEVFANYSISDELMEACV